MDHLAGSFKALLGSLLKFGAKKCLSPSEKVTEENESQEGELDWETPPLHILYPAPRPRRRDILSVSVEEEAEETQEDEEFSSTEDENPLTKKIPRRKGLKRRRKQRTVNVNVTEEIFLIEL